MLDALESRIVAVVGDRLAARPGLAVIRASESLPALDPGAAALRVGIAEMRVKPGFVPESLQVLPGPPPGARRVLSLDLDLRLELSLRPPGPAANPDLAAGRTELLADLSLIGHALADPRLRDGSAFAAAVADAGFQVLSFGVAGGRVAGEPAGDVLTAAWDARVSALIWPVAPPEEEGVMEGIDILVAGLPLRIASDRPRLATGEQASVRLSGLPATRLDEVAAGARLPLRLAVRVVSDLPVAERGTIAEGVAGAETGLRIVPAAAGGEVLVTYTAPTGPLGAVLVETVAFHVATAENTAGVFLGGVTLSLREATPA